jgi:hypothetical protein
VIVIVIAIAICDNGCSQKHDEQFMSKDRLSIARTIYLLSTRARGLIQEEVVTM